MANVGGNFESEESESEIGIIDVEQFSPSESEFSSELGFYSDDSDSDYDSGVLAQQPQTVAGTWREVTNNDVGPILLNFTGKPGVKHCPPPDAKPVDYVKLFFPVHFVKFLVDETNRYARRWIAVNQAYLQDHPCSRVHEQWIKAGETNQEEMYAFLGVIFNMGLIRKPTVASYWDTTMQSQLTPWFPNHFNRNRFLILLKFIHFSDNESLPLPTDPLYRTYKVSFLIEHFNKVFKQYYSPNQEVSIDESMIGYKGKTPRLRQYMPQKHHTRFGLKLWCLCDSTNGYLQHMELYQGKVPGSVHATCTTEEGMTHELVMYMLSECNLLGQGYHVVVDNFFSSPKLFADLYAKNTMATGTVRANRKGLPNLVSPALMRNKEVREWRKSALLCVAYKDGKKRPVLLSSMAHGGKVDVYSQRKNITRQLPHCVAVYNKGMGGVDLSDARLYVYLDERRTIKWTHKCAFSLFGRAILNSYILYKLNTWEPKPLSRYQYTASVVEELVDEYQLHKITRWRMTDKQIEAHTFLSHPQASAATFAASPQAASHNITPLPTGKLRNCVAGHPLRKRTKYECKECDVGLCATCFIGYHVNKSTL